MAATDPFRDGEAPPERKQLCGSGETPLVACCTAEYQCEWAPYGGHSAHLRRLTGNMTCYTYCLAGGEYTIRGDHLWSIAFNGVQVGGLYDSAGDALTAIEHRRAGRVAGANLIGIADPPIDLGLWQRAP